MAVSYEIKVYTSWYTIQKSLLKTTIFSSVILRSNNTKFCTHVVELEGHLEGNVSQIFYLGLSFYFIKSRKLSYKKL